VENHITQKKISEKTISMTSGNANSSPKFQVITSRRFV
jgi:hypothetical protein